MSETGDGSLSPARPSRGMFGVSGSSDTSGFNGLATPVHADLSTPKPYGSWYDEATDHLAEVFPGFGDAIERIVVDRGELTLHVKREHILELCRTMRDDPSLRFELLSSVSGVDYIDSPRRLHAVYHLTSMTYRRRLRLEVATTVEDPHIPSVVSVYPTADWHEREAWDFFGIVFDGHPALTRIQMPDDWIGHPQRKDYPLGGIDVEYKGAHVPPPDERRSYA
ncbi:MAG: NADH-quinone oxidoreductase subunit [Frankiaceae bacterium]|jgi:NADH-quinone oxidoreductase subunit C|nr:NADH-quinone oxidoreductase subunit [Frankiaceae bacterium]